MGWLDKKVKAAGKTVSNVVKDTTKNAATAAVQYAKGDTKGAVNSYIKSAKVAPAALGNAINPRRSGQGGSAMMGDDFGAGQGVQPGSVPVPTSDAVSQAYANGGMPTLGPYEAAYTGGGYQVGNAKAVGDEGFQGIAGMRDVAKNNPWVGLATAQQQREQAVGLDQAGKTAAQANRQASANLAMRGGLRSGASERMARQGAMQQALAQQDVRGQGIASRLGISQEGEKMRQGMMGQLAGAEQGKATYQTTADQWNQLQASEADKWQKQQGIDEAIRKGDYGKFEYGEKAKMYGAGRTADAIARSGPGKSPWYDPAGLMS